MQQAQAAAVPEKKPTSGGAAKAITGCGGCGCATGLTCLLVGAVLLGWGLSDSKVEELVPFGAGILGLSVVVGFLGLALLIGGIVALRRARKPEPGSPPKGPQPSAPQPPQYTPQPQQPPQAYTPQQPGDLPPWDFSQGGPKK